VLSCRAAGKTLTWGRGRARSFVSFPHRGPVLTVPWWRSRGASSGRERLESPRDDREHAHTYAERQAGKHERPPAFETGDRLARALPGVASLAGRSLTCLTQLS